MTTEPERDELNAEQEQLQAEATEPQYVTAAQMQQMLSDQAKQFERLLVSQVGGVQSKVDLGLNAIRRDAQSWMERNIGDLRSDLGRKSFLESIQDDETRRLATALFGEIDRGRNPERTAGLVATTSTGIGEPQSASDAAAWQQVFTIVRNMGIDPQASGIDYAALSDASLAPGARQERFLQSLATLIKETGQTTANSSLRPQSKTPSAVPVVNPPVRTELRGGVSFRNADELRDGFLTGKIDLPEYKKRMTALGETV